jgi:hypothetical protein
LQVKVCREAERAEYAKNKGKAGKGGEYVLNYLVELFGTLAKDFFTL